MRRDRRAAARRRNRDNGARAPACDGHHEMSEFRAAGDPDHGDGESGEAV
jgi:hypothetical protein